MVLILILYKINEQNTKFELTKQTRGFSGGSDGNKSACNAGDLGSIPEPGRPLKKEMATHSSILAREFHGQRSLAGYSPQGPKESDLIEQHTHTHTYTQTQARLPHRGPLRLITTLIRIRCGLSEPLRMIHIKPNTIHEEITKYFYNGDLANLLNPQVNILFVLSSSDKIISKNNSTSHSTSIY